MPTRERRRGFSLSFLGGFMGRSLWCHPDHLDILAALKVRRFLNLTI
ncbi:hypothetical protein C789_1284 [Microcystis aeruginosa FACHB-905 = DIANCHI905]|nr:hypothetical protein C789_1284 [Microcystis aeruginosa FACHB-905 = DIANCHI905]